MFGECKATENIDQNATIKIERNVRRRLTGSKRGQKHKITSTFDLYYIRWDKFVFVDLEHINI